MVSVDDDEEEEGVTTIEGSGNFNPSLGLLSPAWCCHARWAMEHSRDAYFPPLP
jgi:hypothetical protein